MAVQNGVPCLGNHKCFSTAGERTCEGEAEAGVRGRGQTRSEGSVCHAGKPPLY